MYQALKQEIGYHVWDCPLTIESQFHRFSYAHGSKSWITWIHNQFPVNENIATSPTEVVQKPGVKGTRTGAKKRKRWNNSKGENLAVKPQVSIRPSKPEVAMVHKKEIELEKKKKKNLSEKFMSRADQLPIGIERWQLEILNPPSRRNASTLPTLILSVLVPRPPFVPNRRSGNLPTFCLKTRSVDSYGCRPSVPT